jgi:glycosyltransferase involved in cell wall biosynthesis
VAAITIITSSALGSNPRVVKEAEALARRGHKVQVQSTRSLDVVDRRDAAILEQASFSSMRLDLRKLRSWRLRRVLQIGARYGFSALKLEALAPWALNPVAPLLKETLSQSPPADLYIAHYVEALPAAAALAARHGAAYAFDAEDFHVGEQVDGPGVKAQRQIKRAIERRYLPGSLYVTAASPLIAQAYVDTYAIALPTVILNVFARGNAPFAPTAAGSVQPGPSLYWFSQTIGFGRGLKIAIRAIAEAKSAPHLYLRGTPAAGFADELKAVAAEFGVSKRLHFLEPALPDDLERLAAGFDLGYSGEEGAEINRHYSLGNKIFSYLLAGVPILASNTHSQRDLAAQLGEAMAIFPLGDVRALAALIDSYLLNPALLAKARNDAWQLGQSRFNWEHEAERLVALIEERLAAHKARALNGRRDDL